MKLLRSLTYRLVLPLAAACMLSLSHACSDDDNAPTPSGKEDSGIDDIPASERLSLQQYTATRSIMQRLTGLKQFDSDFDTHTYEPHCGDTLDVSQPGVQSVLSETPARAEQYFKALVGDTTLLTPTPDGFTLTLKDMMLWKDSDKHYDLGTLTYHRDDGQARCGYIEVDIPLIPGLQRIDLLPEAAWPNNAKDISAYKVGMLLSLTSTGGSVERSGSHSCTYTRYTGHPAGYYLCVRSCTSGASPGLLVHFEYKDGGAHNLDDDDDGCWYPLSPGTVQDFMDYVNFMQTKQQLKKNLTKVTTGNSIFPGSFYKTGVICDGSQEHLFVIDSDFGAYRVVPAYYWRECTYVKGPRKSLIGEGFSQGFLRYTANSEWDNLVKNRDVYTMNVIYFYSQPIDGAVIKYNPSEDVPEDDPFI